ncbi:MAG: hypothetical protein M1829_002485 [Trizodia sp. TS-e1964]|nr:MAG: hypothetical protein M1829_002485 [Trizodia sp. TS-e1964]
MVRNVGRSRGCQQCRKKKIKCDELNPACSQCLKSGLRCDGPITGPMFVLENPGKGRAATRAGKNTAGGASTMLLAARNQRPPARPKSPFEAISEVYGGDAGALALPTRSRSSTPDRLRASQFSRVPAAGPAKGPVFQDLYVMVWTTFTAIPTQRIENDLFPSFNTIFPSLTNKALRAAIGAASMASYSVISRDPVIQHQSRILHGTALELIRREVVRLGGLDKDRSSKLVPSSDIALAAWILVFFEVSNPTSPFAWLQHAAASMIMLEMRGPRRSQTGRDHALFRAIRYGAVQTSIFLRSPTFFSTKAWMTIPFEVSRKTNFDYLVDILLQISEYLAPFDRICKKKRGPAARAQIAALQTQALVLLAKLKDWWEDYRVSMLSDDGTSLIFHEVHPVGLFTDPLLGGTYLPAYRIYFSDMAAEATTKYDAGCIMILSMFLMHGASEIRQHYAELINKHCESILATVRWVNDESERGNKSHQWHMLLPMRIVSALTSDSDQRDYCDRALEFWGPAFAIAGVTKKYENQITSDVQVEPDIPDLAAAEAATPVAVEA